MLAGVSWLVGPPVRRPPVKALSCLLLVVQPYAAPYFMFCVVHTVYLAKIDFIFTRKIGSCEDCSHEIQRLAARVVLQLSVCITCQQMKLLVLPGAVATGGRRQMAVCTISCGLLRLGCALVVALIFLPLMASNKKDPQ